MYLDLIYIDPPRYRKTKMKQDTVAIQPNRTDPEDEIIALTQQLEEINFYGGKGKGKYPEDSPPDIALAVSLFQEEVVSHIHFLNDLRLAHSIGNAVTSDSQAIADHAQEEIQAQQDRRYVIQISADDPDLETCQSDHTEDDGLSSHQEKCLSIVDSPFGDYWPKEHDAEENEAGPSMTYTKRQEKALEGRFQCCVCCDDFPLYGIMRLQCGDSYCVGCLKSLFIRATKDETLFPPRCHRENIPLTLVKAEMSTDELENFKLAEVEFSTKDRTYCSNTECGRFIPPSRITASEADCDYCGSTTCAMCKNAYHRDDCPSDPALQATLALAREQGWQRCYACRALVQLGVGCYHMTCKCRAQWCYICGVQWKNCSCERWHEQNLYNRAEAVVEREAIQPLPQLERQRRIGQMQGDLLETHECEHPGRFERIFGGRRHRFECEICAAQHKKYILRCRRCHLEVCETCRRHRV